MKFLESREVARREIAWFGRWFVRPSGGLGYLALYIAALSLHRYITRATYRAYDPIVEASLYVLNGLVAWAFLRPWIGLIRTRTLGPLGAARLEQLLVTKLGRKDLWPSLLICPVLCFVVFAIADMLNSFYGILTADHSAHLARLAESSSTVWMGRYEALRITYPLAGALSFFGLGLAMTSAAVLVGLPDSRLLVLLFRVAAVLLFCYVVSIGLSLLSAEIIQRSWPGLWQEQAFRNIRNNLWGSLNTALVGWSVGLLAIAKLRSRGTWRKLRFAAEIGAGGRQEKPIRERRRQDDPNFFQIAMRQVSIG